MKKLLFVLLFAFALGFSGTTLYAVVSENPVAEFAIKGDGDKKEKKKKNCEKKCNSEAKKKGCCAEKKEGKECSKKTEEKSE